MKHARWQPKNALGNRPVNWTNGESSHHTENKSKLDVHVTRAGSQKDFLEATHCSRKVLL